jgi:hypothetical protein
MNPLNDFLEHFKKLLSKEGMVKVFIQESIEKYSQIKIKTSEIKISGTSIFIQTHPVKKNEIRFQSEKILSEINIKTQKNFKAIN